MSSNANLEKFFKSHITIDVISDYEGEEIKSILYDDKKGLIICGDILDSTVGGGSEKSFNNLTGKIAEKIQKTSNLNNILAIVTNPNIHLVFGNRDVNKFKCKFLTKMLSPKSLNKSLETDIYYKFNKGDIDLSYKTYEDLKKMSIVWLADTKHWYPFWNNAAFSGDRKDYWLKEDNKLIPKDILDNEGNFFRRFQRIFGVDGPNTLGTMGAQNLLYTIPLELGIRLDEAKIKDNTYLDYLAFIVLAVFRVMTLYNNIPPKIKKQDIKSIGTQNILNTTILNGLLSKFYGDLPNTSFVSYFNDIINKRLYLFSHGGITSTLIKGINISGLSGMIQKNYNLLINMRGGNLELSSTDIIKNLETVNQTYIYIMKQSFKKPIIPKPYDYKPTQQMLLALSLSALYKPDGNNIFVENSMITPGIDEIQKYLFYCSDKNLVQIFGHSPKGFAINISKHVNNNKKTYLVNLDYSQSYKYTSVGGETNCFLTFETSNLRLGAILNSIIDISQINNSKDKDKFVANSYYANDKLESKLLRTNLKQYILDPRLIDDYEVYKPTGFPDIKYHGLYKDSMSSNEFYVFSILQGREKQLILKKTEYTSKQIGETTTVNLRKVDKSKLKDKYYKYKLKYLKLKMSQLKDESK